MLPYDQFLKSVTAHKFSRLDAQIHWPGQFLANRPIPGQFHKPPWHTHTWAAPHTKWDAYPNLGVLTWPM